MKIFNLKGFMKSEFKPKDGFDYYKIFLKHGFLYGRMISGSKSGYSGRNPENIIVFNGNIITKAHGKIWFGDIDVTKDFDKLKEISNEIKQDLYILREHDARFENEDAGFKYWKKHAVEIIRCKK